MKHLSKATVLALGALLATAPIAAASGTDRQSAAPAAVSHSTNDTSDLTPEVTDGSNYSGDPTNEATLVASEDQRLVQVRTQASIARWTGSSLNVPYRVASGTGYTLVLTARAKDYTLDDLLSLAPKTLVRQPDGSYLLSENIVIESGATLTLSSSRLLTIRMFSSAQKFVSIVNYGGRLNVTGSATAPVKVTSWDVDRSEPRQITDNGRAYIRSIGGTVSIEHASFESLGFWSGRTGGLSMTGSDRPITGAISAAGAALAKHHSKNSKYPEVAKDTGGEPVPGAVLPSDIVPALEGEATNSDFSYVTASVVNTEITDNVYGVFLANAVGVSIHNVTAERSRMDGFVLHRNVSNATIVDSTARHSAVDGFRLSRSIRSVRLDTDKAENNGRDGIYIDGRALATGPSATGTSISSHGNDVVVINSTMTGNAHYGLEIRGGRSTTVRSNTVSDSLMGIVVQDAASGVTVDDNHLSNLATQAVALRDGVTGGKITNNTISNSVVGVYLRDACRRCGKQPLHQHQQPRHLGPGGGGDQREVEHCRRQRTERRRSETGRQCHDFPQHHNRVDGDQTVLANGGLLLSAAHNPVDDPRPGPRVHRPARTAPQADHQAPVRGPGAHEHLHRAGPPADPSGFAGISRCSGLPRIVGKVPWSAESADDDRGQAGTFRPAEGGHVEAAYS